MFVIGADHRGMKLKHDILDYIMPEDKNIKFDIGAIKNCKPLNDTKPIDYPDVAKDLCQHFDKDDKGILICGSGFGMATAANRYKHIRATPCRTSKDVEMARRHGDVNVLCLGADFTTKRRALKMVKVFFETKFEGGRHLRRIKKLCIG